MTIFIFIVAMVVLIGGAYLLSNNKKEINFKTTGILLVAQLVVAWFMLNTSIGSKLVEGIASVFTKILSFGNEGIAFVFGGFEYQENGSVFFISVLLMIIFTSTLLSILNYVKLLPLLIKFLGGAVSKVTKIPMVESFTAIASSIFGNTGGLLAVKSQIPSMNKNRLFVTVTVAMTSVSVSILGSYMMMLPAEYVLVAIPLNVLASLMLATIVAPVKAEKEEKIDTKELSQDKSLFEAIGSGALDGLKVAGIVAAMLIAYISLIALVNYVLNAVVKITLTELMGYILSPIAILMGVPISESVLAGGIMGTKLISNEFVAMLDFTAYLDSVSPKTVAAVTSFLISFANFSSIGIVLGTIQAIDQKQSSILAKLGVKILLVSTMASVMVAAIVGIFVS